ncbi:unnamed protein product [Prorocentrum cordatum]|uniref:DUF4129 domain-containing protein n=1 Tax=Prorocentrum cordatum TaxID=2364126 RepID=A0ABN9TNS2_9DINO|nr:unnamed protein product [Polarella glacialis]
MQAEAVALTASVALAAAAVAVQPQVSESLVPIIGLALLAYAIFLLRKMLSAAESSCYISDNISRRCSFIERRLMGLEFSPWETQRQIAAAIQEWDMAQDQWYASRQAFQYLSRYSRNFLQRTSQMPSAVQLSIIANKAFEESGELASGTKLTLMRQQLSNSWADQFHGQGPAYDASATLSSSLAQLTPHEIVDFFGFQ